MCGKYKKRKDPSQTFFDQFTAIKRGPHDYQPPSQSFCISISLQNGMTSVPDEFYNEFGEKGDTFFKIAEVLYTHSDRQYTQDELAEIVDRSNTTVSNHTRDMVDAEWLDRREDQTTFAWNTEAHNPASTEGITAVKMFYVDFWHLVKKHSDTVPGAFAIVGFALILAATVMFAFFCGILVRNHAGILHTNCDLSRNRRWFIPYWCNRDVPFTVAGRCESVRMAPYSR